MAPGARCPAIIDAVTVLRAVGALMNGRGVKRLLDDAGEVGFTTRLLNEDRIAFGDMR